jgi:hypothetical protein
MVAVVDICNRALSAIGTRSTIATLTEVSNEATQCNLLFGTVRDEILRMAPWNSAQNFNNLALICAAPGTPENPTTGSSTWEKGIPPPPWCYEYAYPSDCLRPLWIVPQFSTGFASGIPITTAVTGGAPSFWNGPPVRFKVGIDQIGPAGVPVASGGTDTKVIYTNQEQAILCYLKQVTDPDIWDAQLQQAVTSYLASRLVIALTGDKALANQKIQEANGFILVARAGDGNEGLTINDVTPDFIRVRGIVPIADYGWSPNTVFDWGPMLSMY